VSAKKKKAKPKEAKKRPIAALRRDLEKEFRQLSDVEVGRYLQSVMGTLNGFLEVGRIIANEAKRRGFGVTIGIRRTERGEK
jgi:hypothetical protein